MEEMNVDGRSLVDLRVVDLKELLEARGLSKSGSKNVLIKRLKDSIALEKIHGEQSGKDPDSAPNMEMKSCGSNFVAEYLEKQQQALLAAKKAAQAARSGPTGDRCSSSGGSTFADDQPSTTAAATAAVNNGGTPVAAGGSSTAATVTTTTTTETTKSTAAIGAEEATVEKSRAVGAEGLKKIEPDETKIEEKISECVREFVEKPAQESDQLKKRAEISTAGNEKIDAAGNFQRVDTDGTAKDQLGEKKPEISKESGEQPKAEENGQEALGSEPPTQQVSRSLSTSSSGRSVDANEHSSDNESIDNDEMDQVDYSRRTSVEKRHQKKDEEDEMEEKSVLPAKDSRLAKNRMTCELIDPKFGDKDVFESMGQAKTGALAAEEKPQRKRRWGSTTVGKRATVSISSDSLKEIVGQVTTTDTMLTSAIEDQIQLDYDDEEPTLPKRIVISREDIDEEDSKEAMTKEEAGPKKEERKKQRFTSVADPLFDEGFIRERPPSPARRPVSNIIHVRCLTRPFTVNLLLEFLSKSGKLVREDFWIDSIKSHCFAKYEKEEDAINAREKLDNIRWPLSNPNVLHADFATENDINRYRNKNAKENEKSESRTTGTTQNNVDKLKPKERTVTEIVTRKPEEKRRSDRSPKRDTKADVDLWPQRREWDKGKEEWRNDGGRSSPTSDKHDRKTLPTPQTRKPDRPRNEIEPVKLLEDLFRKTKTMPCLYWLPLTQEQINEKQKQRKKRELERAEKLRKLEEVEDRERDNWRRKESARDVFRDSSKIDRNRRR